MNESNARISLVVKDEDSFVSMTEHCKMGDIVAMYEMALYIYNSFNDECRHLLCNYEANPSRETLVSLSEYMNKHKRDAITMQYYMMWLVRSAMYGYEPARTIIDRCSFYKEKAYLSCKFYTSNEPIAFWSSNTLREIGILDILSDKIDCRLRFDKRMGCFVFSYMSDYEPPDEDGYGSETEFESMYYDEFFMKLNANSQSLKEEKIKALADNNKIRNEYWKKQKDCNERKYRCRIYEFTERK